MEHHCNRVVIAVPGDLDVTSISCLQQQVDAACTRGFGRITLDMDAVSSIDSAGYGCLLKIARQLRQVQGTLSLMNVRPRPYRTMQTLRMIDMIPTSARGSIPGRLQASAFSSPLHMTTFVVSRCALSAAREQLRQLFSDLALSETANFDMTLAVGEAIGNAVDHTHDGIVLTHVYVHKDRVVVEVTDCGAGMSEDLAQGCSAAQPHSCSQREKSSISAQLEQDACSSHHEDMERGRGLKLMHLLSDGVSIGHKCHGQGTVVRLVKFFDQL